MQRNSPCGPGHLKTGHQLKFWSVFDSEPHLQFTVFSRELLVLQASEDLKELTSLFPGSVYRRVICLQMDQAELQGF